MPLTPQGILPDLITQQLWNLYQECMYAEVASDNIITGQKMSTVEPKTMIAACM
jgi:hypothetical protein